MSRERTPVSYYRAGESREKVVPYRPNVGNLADACDIGRMPNAYSERTMAIYGPGFESCKDPPEDQSPIKETKRGRRRRLESFTFQNKPSALKFLQPCPHPAPGFHAPSEFTGQECFKSLEGGRSPGMGAFGSTTRYSGYPPVRGCQSCGTAGGQTWQSRGSLKLSSVRPISAADLEGIRNIRGLGIGFPGSLGLCKDMPGPGTFGGTYTAKRIPTKGATSVPKCF